ncbi:thiol-disulfide oxidoreductase-associated membrane protein CcdA2 [Streptococcus merionis]|uniref:thiol-disulfide oxidoreductase-associated membrane protein CcdA2 n=1 Tax=Streptococcus merionis TaxID=400065 RepID=UPI0026ECE0AB|nr:thiol-disulfide oxidoreductase-associated membrane protein CcdA2 [Streptococcus merionis]
MAQLLFGLSVFLAGILSFFSPCIFPLLPVYLGILLDESNTKEIRFLGLKVNWYSLVKTLAFIAGLSVVFLILGFGAGLFGSLLSSSWVRYLLGIVVIILGLHQMELISIGALYRQKQVHFQQKSGRGQLLKAFLLGISLSFGWSPCVGPVLSSVLALAASGSSSALSGGFYMLVYSLGLSLPFLFIALSSTWVLNHFNKLKPHLSILKKAGGILIILMGLVMIFGDINSLAALFR